MDSNLNNTSSYIGTPFASANNSMFLTGYNETSILINETVAEPTNLTEGSYILRVPDPDATTTTELGLGFGIPSTALANKIVHYCFGALLILIGIAGAIGNGLVIYVFARYRRLRGGGVPLILSLAAGDFSVSIFHIMPAYSSFKEKWSFGDLGCEIYAASVGLCGLASLLTLSVIAAERFSVIMGAPVRWLSSKKGCALIWIISLALVFPPFVGWSKYETEGIGTSCSWDYTSRDLNNRSYYIFLLTFGFVIPVSVIIISYLGILYVVCKQSHHFPRNGLSKKSPTRNELKTTQVVLSIITCFLISWTPYAVCSMIGQFGNVSLLSPLATALPALFAKASVIYNPFVYSLSHPLFRTAFAALKRQHIGKRNSSGFSLNPRRPHYHLRSHHGTKKTQMVVTAKGNGTYKNRPYNRNGYHLDGQKIQFDGFKGKIPTHLLRHFTGSNNPDNGTNSKTGQYDVNVKAMVHQSAKRSNDAEQQDCTTWSCSPLTTPSNSFRCRQNVKFLKKGAWIFKQTGGPPSESEATAKTAVHTQNDSSSVSDVPECSGNRRKPYLKRDNSKEHCGFMKNSYTFFLCEYRKRRQKAIHKTFFRSENCLTNDSFTEKVCKNPSESNEHALEAALSDKTYLLNDYYEEDHKTQALQDQKCDEVSKQKQSMRVKNKNNYSDESNESDDLVICRTNSQRDYQDPSVERKLGWDKNRCKVLLHEENEMIGNCAIRASNNAFQTAYNGKHLNFIKTEAGSDGTTTNIISSKCPKLKQGNNARFQMEETGGKGENVPQDISVGAPLSSRKIVEKVHPIVTHKSNPKKEDFLFMRKSVSLSGLGSCAAEFFSPSIRTPRKNAKTVLLATSVHNFQNSIQERQAGLIGRSISYARSGSIVSSFQTCEIDSGSCSWYRNNPNTTSLPPYEIHFMEDHIDSSECNSESCYASCKSDLYSPSLEAIEMNSMEELCR